MVDFWRVTAASNKWPLPQAYFQCAVVKNNIFPTCLSDVLAPISLYARTVGGRRTELLFSELKEWLKEEKIGLVRVVTEWKREHEALLREGTVFLELPRTCAQGHDTEVMTTFLMNEYAEFHAQIATAPKLKEVLQPDNCGKAAKLVQTFLVDYLKNVLQCPFPVLMCTMEDTQLHGTLEQVGRDQYVYYLNVEGPKVQSLGMEGIPAEDSMNSVYNIYLAPHYQVIFAHSKKHFRPIPYLGYEELMDKVGKYTMGGTGSQGPPDEPVLDLTWPTWPEGSGHYLKLPPKYSKSFKNTFVWVSNLSFQWQGTAVAAVMDWHDGKGKVEIDIKLFTLQDRAEKSLHLMPRGDCILTGRQVITRWSSGVYIPLPSEIAKWFIPTDSTRLKVHVRCVLHHNLAEELKPAATELARFVCQVLTKACTTDQGTIEKYISILSKEKFSVSLLEEVELAEFTKIGIPLGHGALIRKEARKYSKQARTHSS
eukprot:gb/GEZN01006786.1/.p1 GENE.gb/GEZN01006786.1/~~gb/GEZN01006786.1/.p1  ORF type:complete len:504 (+),score=49.68 gb/GEZN01006786.1/:68-1513(+)